MLFRSVITGEKKPIALPASDVLQFYTEGGTKVSVRPSGTEPKIKFYVSVKSILSSKSEFDLLNQKLDQKIKLIEKDLSV